VKSYMGVGQIPMWGNGGKSFFLWGLETPVLPGSNPRKEGETTGGPGFSLLMG